MMKLTIVYIYINIYTVHSINPPLNEFKICIFIMITNIIIVKIVNFKCIKYVIKTTKYMPIFSVRYVN